MHYLRFHLDIKRNFISISCMIYALKMFFIFSIYSKLWHNKCTFISHCFRKIEAQLASIASQFSDFKTDINPRSWLLKYRRVSLGYLTKMLLFYHGIGFILMIIGTSVIEKVVLDYEEPSRPLYLSLVLSAGPIEETIFFGIPFYVFSNHFVVLAGGIIWAMMHILNTNTFEMNALAYANWLFVIPSLFFSLRTWISGKGWFAVLTHTIWNGIFFVASCFSGETSCIIGWSQGDSPTIINSIIVSGGLLSLTYLLYRRKQNKEK
jgi:hypothetical protein